MLEPWWPAPIQTWLVRTADPLVEVAFQEGTDQANILVPQDLFVFFSNMKVVTNQPENEVLYQKNVFNT